MIRFRAPALGFASPLVRLAAASALVACTAAPSASDTSNVAPSMGGASPSTVTPSKNGARLFDVVVEPAGTNCAHGGQAIVSGSDGNRNGVLEATEVTSKSYVCNGADGKTPVLATRAVPIGTACPTGGQAISWGYDADEDGALDPSEIQSTAYVCNGSNGLDGQNGENGSDGKTTLVTLIPQSPNQHCANGGQGIYSGVDVDGDGLLQPTEVKNTTFVCNGVNGHTSMVRKELEPAGPSCTHGGIRILSGVDTNSDGKLGEAEVTDTAFACNGAPGPAAPVVQTKIDMTAEPAGANCASGGQRIDVGVDIDADGALDPGEVAKTSYVCNGSSAGAVMTTESTPTRTTCPLGGKTITIGADVNGNGVLDASEGGASVTLCRLTAASTSIVCSAGEFAIDEGFDTNRDGKLDPAEISASRCSTLGYRSVASSADGACGLVSDGSLRCWRSGALPARVDALPAVTQLSVGIAGDFAVVTGEGAVFLSAKLSTNPSVNSTPTSVAGLPGPASGVAVGEQHACAVVDGSVHCWGSNAYGQLGVSQATTWHSAVPVVVPSLPEAKAIAAGPAHTCTIVADTSVWCWGLNHRAQLGRTSTMVGEPGMVNGVTGAVAIRAGGEWAYSSGGHSCALLTDGTARCWGDNRSGQLGEWGAALATPSLVGITSISPGAAHTCAVLVDGRTYCWGFEASREGSSYAPTTTPRKVPLPAQATSVGAGMYHSCATLIDGSMRCWGTGAYLGIGASHTGTLGPQLVPAP